MTVSALMSSTILDDRYEVLDQIDRGGMATVYRALDHRLDRFVAIKVLDDARRDEAGIAFREDRLTARLAHPHIVAVYDSGTTASGQPFLVMELIDGRPVSELAPLPVGQALRIAEDVAAAVAYTHERGIVHCDIKPQNILLDGYGRAKLTDFGIASADHAPTGRIVYGSAPYLAPERLRGALVGPAVDIYALGATLYFLLAGQPPHHGRTTDEVLTQAQMGHPRPLAALVPEISPIVEAIVRRAMAVEPDDRYPSAAALCDDLAALRRSSGQTTSALRVVPVFAPPEAEAHQIDPGATTELPNAATAAVPPPPVTTTALPPAPPPWPPPATAPAAPTPTIAERLSSLNTAVVGMAEAARQRTTAWVARADERRRHLARETAVPQRLQTLRDSAGTRARGLARRIVPWRTTVAERGWQLALRSREASRLWLVPLVTAILIVLIVVAGVRTLVDRQSTAVSASATTAVPSLAGLGLGEARKRVVASGLALGRIDTAPLPGQPANAVVYQDPPAGTEVEAGTAINLVIRMAP